MGETERWRRVRFRGLICPTGMNTNISEKSHARPFYIGVVGCLITGVLLLWLCVKAALSLQSHLSKTAHVDPLVMAVNNVSGMMSGGLLLSLMLQWAILTVLVMILLDPKRRAG